MGAEGRGVVKDWGRVIAFCRDRRGEVRGSLKVGEDVGEGEGLVLDRVGPLLI